jgi:DNA-binding response OmpR family regulator
VARILVAADHDDARGVFSSVLRGAEHEVFEAVDGLAAFDLFERNSPHVALIDSFMPGRDGVDVIRAMRADAWEAGADGTLSKPIDHRFLVGEVDRLLRQHPLEG